MSNQIPRPTVMLDTECYIDYWLCMFESGEVFEQFEGHPLDTVGLRNALARYRVVTFNGNSYDLPIIESALSGASCEQLKGLSDWIIQGNNRIWHRLDWVDHIDMIEVAPGQASLKMYGAKLHARRLQDLPYKPSDRITWPMRVLLREYCRNDLITTRALYSTFPQQLSLREQMSAEYGVDLRSKSDAQISEAVMKSLLQFKPERPRIAPGSTFYYQPPDWLQSPLLGLLARCPFTITDKGTVEMSAELAAHVITIGKTSYHLGMGGLHSMESNAVHYSDDERELSDHDVASYYPSLILRTGIYPVQIGAVFLEIYRGWYETRLAAKHAGDKKRANSLKTLLNGTFGKLWSVWSIYYAPAEGVQVTVTGQLALLMLIELLESAGVSVVSANTDGIVLSTPRYLLPVRDAILKYWEAITGFETERTQYRMIMSRDVNSYVAITDAGEVKLKGQYAPPEPGASGWPNPTGQICVTAIIEYLKNGTAINTTIRACTDIRQFVYVRQVKGGGSYCPNGTLDAKTTQKVMREYGGFDGYAQAVARNVAEREYLGKAVRWYYAKGSPGCIVTPSGGLVARTDGCKPLMELPDTLPDDIDCEWYINEAQSMMIEGVR